MAVQEKKLTIGKNKILMADEEDGELASEAVENREAFAELYRRHVDRVYRYFMFKVGNSLDAQELTSQTFLAALENIAHYRGEGSFLGWLFGIANRKAAQFYGKNKFKPIELGANIHDSLPPLDQSVEQSLEFKRVLRALEQLTSERAEIIRLYFFSGLTAAEVARIKGKSEPAIRMLIHRSLNDLKKRLELGEAK